MQLTLFTDFIWVSFIAWLTNAHGSVVVDPALGIDATSGCVARVDTLLTDTSLGSGTVWVNSALRLRRCCKKRF